MNYDAIKNSLGILGEKVLGGGIPSACLKKFDFFVIFSQLNKIEILFNCETSVMRFYIFLKINDVFTPPNAKLFDITMSVFISRPLPII